FDTSGIANQYRVVVSASLRVLQSGKTLWVSGDILRSGDVFATGGAIAIAAQKERIAEALRDEWVQKALGRLRSGF
ncbi:MAG: adenosylmethionine-8-amino-7-oxononanoate aminotransferase, partial [Mariprofundaceae bacterium]|nr:adenosylmethionine-8-amino-7-oxononanoate aminotransferase [Mariprofundaceae bacterium]